MSAPPVAAPARTGAVSPLRSALFAGWMFGSAIVLGLLCLPVMLGPRRWAMGLIQVWARGVFGALRVIVGATVEVRGREHIPAGACLIAAKHQSMLDTLVAMTLTPWPCIVLKRELMLIPIFGWYAWKSGMIALDRKGGPGDVRQLLAAARRALAEGRQVVIYPEGTRRAPGAPPAYKGGIGLLYKELGVACVPCATDGGHVWPAHGLLKHPGRAVFEVLPALAPGLARKGFMARLEAAVEGAARRLEADSESGS